MHRSGTLDSGLYWQSWQSDDEASLCGVVLIVHGLAEHSGRYQRVADHLNRHGFVCYGVDHIGHGRSPGARCLLNRFSDLTDGVDALFALIRAQHPALPVTILGHSLGGLIASMSVLAHPDRYRSAVLSGPAVLPVDPPPAWQEALVRGLSRLIPSLGVVALEADAISRDPEVVKAYFADPLVYNGKVTARMATEIFSAMAAVQAQASSITLPILLMHGAEDRITAPAGSQWLHDSASSSDKTLRFYEGAYHEIFNEPEHLIVLKEMTDWLSARH